MSSAPEDRNKCGWWQTQKTDWNLGHKRLCELRPVVLDANGSNVKYDKKRASDYQSCNSIVRVASNVISVMATRSNTNDLTQPGQTRERSYVRDYKQGKLSLLQSDPHNPFVYCAVWSEEQAILEYIPLPLSVFVKLHQNLYDVGPDDMPEDPEAFIQRCQSTIVVMLMIFKKRHGADFTFSYIIRHDASICI